ncbi:MAG: putative molybdenum carrier protein [Salinibacter sp.]|uniref:putative molybdenum carrier protein n=1 Tax=Salinibacter sp. TaxID=2065818 RepID=UPI0035D4BC5C
MQIQKIVSGGQTGVDRAALDAALAAGVDVGGWCPAGRRAEDGRIPDRYPLTETPSDEYAQRTRWNVRDSDGTLILAPDPLEGGTALTRAAAEHQGQPVLHVRLSDTAPTSTIRDWGAGHDVHVLNVAGPRASEVDDIYRVAREMLDDLLTAVSTSN